MLIRKMVSTCRWPSCWREHWVVPLLKKKSKADTHSFQGIHLTPQLSKVTERVVGNLFQRFLERIGAYGERQFAYSKGTSVHDTLSLSVLMWLMLMEHDVGVNCSDVSGHCDRVCANRMTKKQTTTHLQRKIHGLLASRLEPRVSQAPIGGKFYRDTQLTNSMCQGRVCGPPLRNC